MNKSRSRAPSPTPTAFSGISNYRNDSYRPIRDKNVPAVPTIDYRLISRTHFDELTKYLAAYLAKAAPNSRSTARQKLTRLTIQQFHELSTDVYDELVRRKNEKEVPFLPVREEFHPKRNQARQKLATLPTTRFEDLSSDVYYELARRYPEFKEDPSSPGSTYDDQPNPEFPAKVISPRTSPLNIRTSGRASEGPIDSGYGGSVSGRRPSEDRRRPSEVDFSSRRSEDTYAPGRSSQDTYTGSISSRRRPSVDTTRKSDERDRERGDRRAQSVSVSGTSDSASTAAQSTTATSGMIVPIKSTIAEEEIQVPYGRDARESGSTMMEEDGDRSRDRSRDPLTDAEPDSASEYLSPRSPLVGLSGLSARLKDVDDEDDEGPMSPQGRSGDEYYDKYGRSSVQSDRSGGATGIGARMMRASAGGGDDQEKMRREYEFKIATMQNQISTLQRDLGDTEERERKWNEGEVRVRQMEEELLDLRRRAEEQSAAMLALQKELDDVRETRSREKEREARRAQEDEEELQILRDRCETLEEERVNGGARADPEIVEQLKSDMEGLLLEVTDLSRRNDELMSAKDSDLSVIREQDAQLKEYKRKYEQAKTELRNVKATSQLFLQAPKQPTEDQLPVSPDGGILDIHVTAFLSAIDSLLTAGRSNAPTRVLTPMKSVVNSVSAIVDDVRMFERRPQRDRSDVDLDALRSLRERAEATLSNLVTASKTHATSSGMSPVSLLDAAASHVSATVTEIGRTVCIRKATKAEQEQFTPVSYASSASATNGFAPSLRSVDELKGVHQRTGSTTSSSSRGRFSEARSPVSPSNNSSRSYGDSRRRAPSEHSSSGTNSPPPIFDQPPTSSGGVMSDDSAMADGPEDAWAELKPYLEAQTDSIVYAIQSVLTSVRSPTPSPSLDEHLTQIITIVTSIVAVCNDNLPPATSEQGTEILRELSEHANKLSEVQALSEVTKESRQIMAKSSFAVANAMKGLMKL